MSTQYLPYGIKIINGKKIIEMIKLTPDLINGINQTDLVINGYDRMRRLMTTLKGKSILEVIV